MSKKKASKASTPAFDQAKYDSLLKTAQRLAIIHSLVNSGIFQGKFAKDIFESSAFVEEMHKGVMVELEPMQALKEKLDEEKATAPEVPADVQA